MAGIERYIYVLDDDFVLVVRTEYTRTSWPYFILHGQEVLVSCGPNINLLNLVHEVVRCIRFSSRKRGDQHECIRSIVIDDSFCHISRVDYFNT